MNKIEAQVKIPQFKEGIIRGDTLTDFLSVESSAEMSLNMNFDTLGAPQIRKGISKYSTNAFTNVKSLGSFSKNASSTRRILVQDGLTIYSIDPATPNVATSTRTLTGTGTARFTQLLDYTYMVNGSTGDAVQTFNGTAWGTTNVDLLPKGDYIETFSALIWIADVNADKIYYTNTPTIAGLVTGGNNFIFKLSPQDGEIITGLKTVPNSLLVFKQNHIYRIYSESSADAYPAYNVGTYSNESIITGRANTYFHHSSGFYKFNYDSQPTPISQRIQDFCDAIPRANYSKIFGWSENDYVYWNIGDVTVDGTLYKNCVVRYTETKEIWTIYSYGQSFNCALTFDTSTNIETFLASTSYLYKLADNYTDDGVPIQFNLITRWTNLTQYSSSKKSMTEINVMNERLGGVNMFVQFDSDTVNKWYPLGSLKDTFVTNLATPQDTFNRVRFMMSGSVNEYNTGAKSRFLGIEIPFLTDYGVGK